MILMFVSVSNVDFGSVRCEVSICISVIMVSKLFVISNRMMMLFMRWFFVRLVNLCVWYWLGLV